MTSTSVVALVSCSSKKRAHAAPARDFYTSDLFVKSFAVARRLAPATFIVSAKHGLVEPTAIVEPYDVALSTMTRAQRADWSARVVAALVAWDGWSPAATRYVYLFAGEVYAAPLRERFGAWATLSRTLGAPVDYVVIEPLAGMQIGERLGFLRRELKQPSLAAAASTSTEGARIE